MAGEVREGRCVTGNRKKVINLPFADAYDILLLARILNNILYVFTIRKSIIILNINPVDITKYVIT